MTQDIYEQYRVGGDVEKAIKGLELLQYYNYRAGGRVAITPQFLVLEHNKHQMNDFRALCESLNLIPTFKEPYIRDGCRRLPNSEIRSCRAVKNAFHILLDGTVVLCCYDHNGETAFGNIYRQSVMEIWGDSNFKEQRRRVMFDDPPEFCIKECLLYES
jgi:MoaA/NifB/PqqE/SkfB family radical SAM enzyme